MREKLYIYYMFRLVNQQFLMLVYDLYLSLKSYIYYNALFLSIILKLITI